MTEPYPFAFSGWNPLAGNPLRTRADCEEALRQLVAPLSAYISPGRARIRLSAGGAVFDRAAADLEGFARPLWGLAPAAAGGAAWIDWESIRRGLANGVDPAHPEYWGDVGDVDQRMVELAAIGYALRLVPELLWEPLPDRARAHLSAYLIAARAKEFSTNNWRFFRLMIDLGLETIGLSPDPEPAQIYREDIERLYLSDGWYRDGPDRRADYYIPFAIHFYGLLLAAYGKPTEQTPRWRERARAFAPQFMAWFSQDGSAIPFGRSMTYRFAMAAFWGALAVADEEVLPWGVIKGLWLRHLRWWSGQPIADRDGILSIGYGYPNLLMSEPYNSAGSPYWALKVFAPLALPESHPFWQAEEEVCPARSGVSRQSEPGALLFSLPGDAVALFSGQETTQAFRHTAEKYGKFAYSARYGFSIESDLTGFENAVLDSMLGLSDDGRHFRVRASNVVARIGNDFLYSLWKPWPDVEIETWLLPRPPGHMRIHRIRTPRPLDANEGGFAVARTDNNAVELTDGADSAVIITAEDASAILDLGSTVRRAGVCHPAPPNTNLISSRTWVPQLRAHLPAGETILRGLVVASCDPRIVATCCETAPSMPDIATLEEATEEAQTVGVADMDFRPQGTRHDR
ncbi:DUF2264 domain-containing protein [Rhizobium sp. GR12]|uniref:DUF2264 domain-containing protein n=1 Tax=Rhizobium sp. GR12 TaxID=3053925 RepID=UPI002FBE73F7